MDIISSVPFWPASVPFWPEKGSFLAERDGNLGAISAKRQSGQDMADDEFEFERTFGWLMHDVQRLIRRTWARALKSSGLDVSEPQARILANLLRQEDGLTQTQLAAELEMEKAPLGRLLDRMEEGGYIERHPDPKDRRVRRVFLSGAGAGAIPSIKIVTREVFADAFKGVPDDKIDVMVQVLADIKSNLSPLETEQESAAVTKASKNQQ